MCGIVGYVGKNNASDILIEGLSKLEYRGYDSAGIAVYSNGKINLLKACGKLINLENKLALNPMEGNIGIGHTRWATHGAPCETNAHPHVSGDGKIAVVHNGIIENYMEIKNELLAEGYKFASETDSETVAHLIDYYCKKDMSFFDAVYTAVGRLRGAYALCVICADCPDTMIAVRKDCPLIIGLGEGENFAASDIPAILHRTRNIYFIEDGEFAVIKSDSVKIFDSDKKPVSREIYKVTWDVESAEKGGFDHFMLKEIYEQPKIIREMVRQRFPESSQKVCLDDIRINKEQLKDLDRIYIVACGTAYHAGLIGKTLIERIAKIPVEVEVASEFRYKHPILDSRTLLIVVSQSGETADTLEALRIAKKHGTRVLAVVNVVGSTIAREADDVFYLLAGPEIAVASTKAFSAQYVAMCLIACHIATELGKISAEELLEIKNELYALPDKIQKVIDSSNLEKYIISKYLCFNNAFFIGRGLDYVIARESSLKMKELSYFQSEAYAAGELKHGPIAMIDDRTVLIALVTQQELFEKTVSNIKEVKARGANVIAITTEHNKSIEQVAEHTIYVPDAGYIAAPLLANVATQFLAYYMALGLERDIDKPRNLAKSVTVE